ncbi:hypothetical protein GGR16_002156 [Chelatococcus caeni]|uniref:DUF1194 domain-containing protein n=1 Tax=Chelatococcus caeni TaxID=1348468 RepID=A0A840C3Y6_9HYPH|nr:DUF1194 domain-containing protein [Chelatococcus caeni]MBB4017127.1 hypothetical protein [Chelatococcus caeni]
MGHPAIGTLPWGSFAGAALACLMMLPAGALAQAGPQEVDVALVIAVDISYSMDEDEQRLQRKGYVEALRSTPVLDAIARGPVGRIAATYVEWAGSNSQDIIVPWQVIEGPESADAFVERIAAAPIRRAYRTSISGAIDFSANLFGGSGFTAMRQVIDISGDGPNNQGRPVTDARDEAVARNITINGLPLLYKRSSYMDIADLDIYYRDCVIGGLGAFVVPVRELEQFPDTIRKKLVMEIAGIGEPTPQVERTAAEKKASCLVGEWRWNERMGN